MTQRPDPSHVRALLSRYAPARLDVTVDHLTEGDRRALDALIDASSWIDHIYWKQRSDDAWRLDDALVDENGDEANDLKRLIRINFGPWDNFDEGRPFLGTRQRSPGGNLYPADLTRDELERYLVAHPHEQPALLSHTTLIRRQGRRLVAVPYADAYREELGHAAAALVQASDSVSHDGFRQFLRARARGLVSGELRESEALWIGVGDSPIDIAIGPFEVYDDALMGLKTSYEATVMVRHPMTGELTSLPAIAPDVDERFPGAVAPADGRPRRVIGLYDVVHTAGMTNMGGKAIAATLPNDEDVRTTVGARLLLFRNVITAKFEPILRPLAARVLRSDQISLVREDAFLEHTLLHEMAHAVGTNFVWRGGKATGATINDALRERYSTVDECRADLVGLVFLDWLTRRGAFRPDMTAASAATFVVSSIRTLRFGGGESHGQGAAIIMSHLLRTGAVEAGPDGRLAIDVAGVHQAVARLAARVQRIATRGDYEAAGRLIAELGSMPAAVAALVNQSTDIPVDLEFIFAGSGG